MKTEIDLNCPEFLQSLMDSAIAIASKSTWPKEGKMAMDLASVASAMLINTRHNDNVLASSMSRHLHGESLS
jgi:hypothetical protein